MNWRRLHDSDPARFRRAVMRAVATAPVVRLLGRTADPTNPKDGQVWPRTDTDVLYGRIGSTTVPLASPTASAHVRLHSIVDALDHAAGTLGNIIYAGAAGAWALLAGNTTTTKKFLTQTGDGANSAAPAWGTIEDGDVPATLARDSEVTSAISTHAAVVDAHHAKYTDAEALAAAKAGAGISDDDLLQMDDAAAASGEYLRLTANGPEGRSADEAQADLASGMKQTMLLTAAAGNPTTSSGCGGPAQVEAGTNDVDYIVLDFDKDSDEYAFWGPIPTPNNWDGSTITAIFYWTTAAGGAAETVCWSIQMIAVDNDDPIDQAWGSAVTVTDTWIADGDIHESAESGAITPATTVSREAGDLLFVRVMRDVSEDDLGGDARLIAVKLRFGVSDLSG